MAEEIKSNGTETNPIENQQNNPGEGKAPSVEELMSQLAEANNKLEEANNKLEEANNRADRNKSELDKALKENGTLKKEKRASMSEAERVAEEKAEADRLRDEHVKDLEARLNRSEAEKAYKSVSDEKMVESLIDAVSDADHIAIANILEKYASAKVKEAQAEWMKSRPRVNMGGEGSLTKEQFNNMSIADKSKLYRENKAEYDRLNS